MIYFKFLCRKLEDYTKYGKWVGINSKDENCSNPKALYESVISKPEDMFYDIKYLYFDGFNSTEIWARLFALGCRNFLCHESYFYLSQYNFMHSM